MRNLGLIIAIWLAALLPTNSLALGLGEIEVTSFLNQPLNAEIQVISARPGEIDDLLVSLASREAFTRAGLSRPRHLSDLRFTVKKSEEGDEAVVIVTTKSAVKEPFLNFLIEADWSKGRVLREFTVLLDPPFYADQPAPVETTTQSAEQPASEEPSVSDIVEQAGVTSTVDTSEPTESSSEIIEPIALTEDTSPEMAAEPESSSQTISSSETFTEEIPGIAQGDVTVVKGDTLWSIASRYKDEDHSMAQVMLAFQRSNPDAFNDGNINNLRKGAVLRAPGADEIDAMGKQESYAEVLVQNGLWDEYVARVTGVSPAVASEEAAGEVTAEDGTSEQDSGELSLLLPGDGDSESTGTGDASEVGDLRTRLALAEEELDASRIENQDLEARIAELQLRLSKVEELQKMVEIEDDSLAAIQEQQDESTEAVEQLEEQAANDSVTEAIESNEEALLEELLAEEAAAQAEEQAVIDGSDTEPPAGDDALVDEALVEDGMSEDETMEEPVVEDSVAEESGSDEMISKEAETESTLTPPAPVILTEPVTRSPSIFDGILPPSIIDMIPSMPSMSGILGDPIILAAVGGVIVLLLVLVILKRRKAESDDESGIVAGVDEDLFASEEEDELTPIHLADGAESVETDIKLPTEEDLGVEETSVEPEDDLAATAIISAVDMPEPEAPAPAATGDQDDVLNEVDVYLAYGLYDNAEELLNSSLTENPDRADYRAKLLDTYFATKNSDAFAKEAEKLKSMGDAASGYWDRVQIMGYELAPDNALFSDAKDSDMSSADLEISRPQEADFDLGASEDDDTNFSTTDFNLGEDDTGGDFTDTASMGEAGVIAETQQIQKLDELPDLDFDDEDDTNLRNEAEPDAPADLPDSVGDELEFSMDDEESGDADVELPDDLDLGTSEEPAVAAANVDMDELAMEFDIDAEEAAQVDELSEVDFGAEFEAALEQADDLDDVDDGEGIPFEADLTDSTTSEVVIDDDAVELDAPALEATEVVPGLGGSEKNEDEIDLGMDDTAMIDFDPTALDELTSLEDETSLATGELNLETSEQVLPEADDELDDDEDISIIDFGGEDFVEPTDIIESIADDDDSVMMGVDDDEDTKTGTFAPGDFEEPTEAVDPISDIDDIGDLMLPDDVDEVSTKLDLARAFIDMGDTEGARGSLEEVMSEGNDEQKSEAKSLLDQI